MEPGSIYILVLCAWQHGVRRLHSNKGLRTILPSLIFSDAQGLEKQEKQHGEAKQGKGRQAQMQGWLNLGLVASKITVFHG